MSDEHTPEPEADDSPGSVFGNLPGSRPGTRSPRRGAEGDAKRAAGSAPKRGTTSKAQASTGPKRRAAAGAQGERPASERRQRPASTAGSPGREPPEPESGGGLEDIAWAGVAAAAEAATLGVRLASRAIEALRGKPERD